MISAPDRLMKFSVETRHVETFIDCAVAVINGVMVFGLLAPQGTEPRSLLPTLPAVAAYALSFVLIAIYWNRYRDMLHASWAVDGRAMWANLHLVFWLSLVPFATAWLSQNPRAILPTLVYALMLLFCAFAYAILQRLLLRGNGLDVPFASAAEINIQEVLPIVLYVVAMCTAFVSTIVSDLILASAAGFLYFSGSPRRAIDRT